MDVLLKGFPLIGLTLGFYPHTRELQPELRCSMENHLLSNSQMFADTKFAFAF